MTKTGYPGIDYGRGQSNIDRETGIRYGVIPLRDLHEFIYDDVEGHYTPRCPECGDEFSDDDLANFEGGEDVSCACGYEIYNTDSLYGDEADYQTLNVEEYVTEIAGNGIDVFVIKSPYYTHAQFCSPCAPGAGYLTTPCPDGPKTYCFGHDMFDGNKAPYPVYSVETGELVEPESDKGD